MSQSGMIGTDNLAKIFGVHAAEQSVEPTKSENIIVTWRRSAAMSLAGAATVEESSEAAGSIFVHFRPGLLAKDASKTL